MCNDCVLPSRTLFVLLILAIFSRPSVAGETAMYELTFDATWSAETHPVAFPPGPHFSGLIGATHNSDYSLWGPGGIATVGIKNMAETGSRTAITNEVEAQIATGSADSVLKGPSISRSPDSRSMTFEVDSDFPLVSLVSMIAPSPDWFVGIHGAALRTDDQWVPSAVYELAPYDAGTDSGINYTSSNEATQPQEPIRRLTDGSFNNTPALGTFSLLRIVEGDFTRDGLLTVDDINDLSAAVRSGTADPIYDVDSSGVVDADDRTFWIEQLRETVVGDSNLDGVFNSDDFVFTFIAGEYNDGIPLNSGWESGDWDGDGDYKPDDFVFAFIAGAYTADQAAVAAVPEPTSGVLAMLGATALLAFRRSRSINV